MHDDDLRNIFTAYMQKAVAHAKVDYIRRKAAQGKKRETKLPDWQEPSYEQDFRLMPEDEFDFEEGRLAEGFASLPLLRRRVLTLLFVQQLSPSEVAEEIGCAVDYVYAQKRQALQKLRDLLGGGEDNA